MHRVPPCDSDGPAAAKGGMVPAGSRAGARHWQSTEPAPCYAGYLAAPGEWLWVPQLGGSSLGLAVLQWLCREGTFVCDGGFYVNAAIQVLPVEVCGVPSPLPVPACLLAVLILPYLTFCLPTFSIAPYSHCPPEQSSLS